MPKLQHLYTCSTKLGIKGFLGSLNRSLDIKVNSTVLDSYEKTFVTSLYQILRLKRQYKLAVHQSQNLKLRWCWRSLRCGKHNKSWISPSCFWKCGLLFDPSPIGRTESCWHVLNFTSIQHCCQNQKNTRKGDFNNREKIDVAED